RRAREAEAGRALCARACGARLHVERPARGARRRERARRVGGRRRGVDARTRLAAAARRPEQVLLEERQVAARARAADDGSAGLLGALRLPQRGGLLEGRALRLLTRLDFYPPGTVKRPSQFHTGRGGAR